MNLLLTVLACGASDTSFDLSGIWRFEMQAPDLAEQGCDQRLLHNVLDTVQDTDSSSGTDSSTNDTGAGGFVEEDASSSSPATTLGRFARDGDGWMLIINGELLEQEDGGAVDAPTFAWERSSESRQSTTHPSGYSYLAESQQTAVTRVQIELPNEQQQKDALRGDTTVSLVGSIEEGDESLLSWEEADLWPEELGLGETGAIPLSSYLTRLDELGDEVAVTNQRAASDCGDDTCVLTVSDTCAQSSALTATLTDLDPADPGWQDLGWPTGY